MKLNKSLIIYPRRKNKTPNGFYQSKEWRQDAKAHLANNPLCVMCEHEGRTVEATVSDHIVPINHGGPVWSWVNRQALCYDHHQKKSSKERDNL